MGGLFFQNQKDKLKGKSKRQIRKADPKGRSKRQKAERQKTIPYIKRGL